MKIERLRAWSDELARGLGETVGRDLAEIREGINLGALEAYRLWDGAAYMVTRLEGRTLTCCCYRGERVAEALAWVLERGPLLGFDRVIFHTRRKGLARLLRDFEPAQLETIYEIPVKLTERAAA